MAGYHAVLVGLQAAEEEGAGCLGGEGDQAEKRGQSGATRKGFPASGSRSTLG
jgi:hypothetical protein